MSHRAALLALALAATLTACGEKEERVSGPSRAEITALVGAGLRAVGSDPAAAGIRFSAGGRLLRIRLASPPAGGPLRPLLALVRPRERQASSSSARSRRSCAAGRRSAPGPRRDRARRSRTSVTALRRLAARTYDGRLLVRRRGALTQHRHRERRVGGGRADAGRRAWRCRSGGSRAAPAAGASSRRRLELDAGAAALGAMRRDLPPRAGRALAGVERLTVVAPLP